MPRQPRDWTALAHAMNDKSEDMLKKLAATMAPVFDAQRQLLGLMMELKVQQNDMAGIKARVEKMDAALERIVAELGAMKETAHGRMRAIEGALAQKADKSDLKDLAKDAKAHEISTAKLLGAFTVISALASYLLRKL